MKNTLLLAIALTVLLACTPKKNGTATQKQTIKTEIDYTKAYSTLITEWKNDNDDNSAISYALYDIDGNGIEELILVHPYYGIAYVYTLKDGKPI